MRVVSVPGRIVRHPVTRRVINERGISYDPHDFTIAHLVACGDLALVDDPEADTAEPVAGTSPADPAPEANETASADAPGAVQE